jgi:hypothetical protein
VVSVSASPISQIAFARLMGVSRQTVNAWKRASLIAMVGKSVDAPASRARLLMHASSGSKALIGAQRLSTLPLEATGALYDPPMEFENPANLPPEAVSAATAIEDGAATMARIIAPHLPMPLVRALVEAWIDRQRDGWVGGEGLPESVAQCDDWPVPLGYQSWRDHPLFASLTIDAAEWAEIEAEAAAHAPPRATSARGR